MKRLSDDDSVLSITSNRKLPTDGWNEQVIESFLLELSQLDSNNFLGALRGWGARRDACILNGSKAILVCTTFDELGVSFSINRKQ